LRAPAVDRPAVVSSLSGRSYRRRIRL
jgi:hypothetical protein